MAGIFGICYALTSMVMNEVVIVALIWATNMVPRRSFMLMS